MTSVNLFITLQCLQKLSSNDKSEQAEEQNIDVANLNFKQWVKPFNENFLKLIMEI